MFRRAARGFTLIELMIVVAVMAILAALAYYNYGRYAFRTRRADGREMLMRVAAAEERYFTNFNAYTNDLTDPATAGGLGFSNATSEKGYYTIAVTLANANASYTLVATRQGAQINDQCKNLTLTDTGVKGFTGAETNGTCW